MNLSNIFESTDFVHASGTKEELQVAEFLKAQCEALGVPAHLELSGSTRERLNLHICLQMGRKLPVRRLTAVAAAA